MHTLKYYMLILATLFFCSQWIAGCSEKKDKQAAEAQEERTYTCPMHPQVIKNEPGDCPICGMSLVLFDKRNTGDFLILGASQQALANISVLSIDGKGLSSFTRLNGRIVVDPNRTRYISSRVGGRIDALFIKETGASVQQGQPLYKIYSEQLSTMQQEYLLLTAQAQGFPTINGFNNWRQRQNINYYYMANRSNNCRIFSNNNEQTPILPTPLHLQEW